MAVLHPLTLASLLDAESLPVVFGFSSHDLEVNRTLRLSWQQRFSPALKLLPFVVFTSLLLWLINEGFSMFQPLLLEAEFLQALAPAATGALLVNRFWNTICKAVLLPWSEIRVLEGMPRKSIEVEQDAGVRIVRYCCVIGGETLSVNESQFNVLRLDIPYRAYVAYPSRHIVSIETLP